MAQAQEVAPDLLQAGAHGGGDLDLRLEQLVLHLAAIRERSEPGRAADIFHEGRRQPGHGVHQQVLFFDANGDHVLRLPCHALITPSCRGRPGDGPAGAAPAAVSAAVLLGGCGAPEFRLEGARHAGRAFEQALADADHPARAGSSHRGPGSSLYAFGAVWLLQRGSPESKPVGAPHSSTGVEG